MYYVYLLLSKLNKQIYIGSANNIKKRLKEHNNGKVISTKRYRPWILFYYEAYLSEKLARLREKRLKYNGNALRELKKRIGLLKSSKRQKNLKSGAGFTFIEVLLVLGIIGILVGLAIPFYQSFQVSSQLDNSTQEIVQTLRRAQARSMASESLADFGVHFEGRKFVLFQGAIYNPADPLNEAVDLPNTLTITPATDVVFSMIKGVPDSINSVLISTSRESKTITINELGVVNAL